MVLRSVLGGGKDEHKMEFVEEKAFGSVPVVFFDVRNRVLPESKPAIAAAA